MSEQNTTPDAQPTPDTSPTPERSGCGPRCARGKHSRRRRWGRRLGLLAVLALGVFAVPRAFGWGGHSCHSGDWSADEVREHMGFVADHALDRVDATDAQVAAVDQILDEAAPKMAGFHEEAHDLRQRFHKAVLADPTDQASLEDLRKEALDLADRASGAALQDLTRAAAVLTPDQRTKLAQHLQDRWDDDQP